MANGAPLVVQLELAAAAGGTVWISGSHDQGSRGSHDQGSRGSLQSVGLDSPGSARDQRPSMIAVTIHRFGSLPSICSLIIVLFILVPRARKLEKKGMFGKADPYVIVKLGDQKLKSKAVGGEYVRHPPNHRPGE